MRWLWLTVVVSVVYAQRQSEAYLPDESDLPKASKISGEANKVKAQEAVPDGGSSPTAPRKSSYEPDAPPRYTRPDSAPAIEEHTKEPHDSDGPPKYVRPDNAPATKGRKKHWRRPSSLKGPRKHIRPKEALGTKGHKEDPLAEYGREPVKVEGPAGEESKSVSVRPLKPEGPPKDVSSTTDSTNAVPDVSTDVVYVKYPPPSPPRAQTVVESYNLPPPPEPESELSVTAPAHPSEKESSKSSKAVENVKKEDQLEHKEDIGEGPKSPAEGNAPSYPTDNGEIHSPSSSNADRATSNVTTTAQPAGYQNPQGKAFVEATAIPAAAATVAPLPHNLEQPKAAETVEKPKSEEKGKDVYVESAPIEATFGGVEGSGSLEEVGGEGSGESAAKPTADKKVEGTTQESTTPTAVEEEKAAEDRYEVGPHGEGSGETYSHHVLDSHETSETPREQPGAESKSEAKVEQEPSKEVEFKEKEGEATVPKHELKQEEIGEKGVETEMEKAKEAVIIDDEKSEKESPEVGIETSSTPKTNSESEKESAKPVNLEKSPQEEEGSNKNNAESSTAEEGTTMSEQKPYEMLVEDAENGTAAELTEEAQTVPEKSEEITKFNYAVNKAQVVEGGTNMSEEDFTEGVAPEEATAENAEASKSEESDKKKQDSNGPLVKIDSTSKDHDIVIAYSPTQPKKQPHGTEESIDEAAVEKSDPDDEETSTAPWEYPTAPGERTAPLAVLAAHAAQDATFVDRAFVAKQLKPKEDEEESLDEAEAEQNAVLEPIEETTTDHYVTAPEKFQPHDKPVAEYSPDLTHSEAEEDAESSKASVNEDFADLPVAPSSGLEQTSKELVKKVIEEVVKTTASSTSEAKTTTTRQPWTPYEMDCETEVDDKGELCKDWARGGLCTIHRPTMFLFCRKTCLCTGPYRFARS